MPRATLLTGGRGGGELAFADRPTAVHGEDLSGDKPGGGGEEEDHRGVGIGRLADAAAVEGLFGADELEDLRVVGGALGHGGFDQGRGKDIDPDILGGVGGGDGFGESEDAAFGGGVGVAGEMGGGRGPAEDGAEVEDDPGGAMGEKIPDGGAIGIDDGFEVEAEGAAEAVVGQFVQGTVAEGSAAATGDVVEAVEAMEAIVGEGDGLGGGEGIAGIGGEGDGAGSEGGFGGGGAGRVTTHDHQAGRASLKDGVGGGEAEAGGATDHDEHQVVQGGGDRHGGRSMSASAAGCNGAPLEAGGDRTRSRVGAKKKRIVWVTGERPLSISLPDTDPDPDTDRRVLLLLGEYPRSERRGVARGGRREQHAVQATLPASL